MTQRKVIYDSAEAPPQPPVATGVATPRGGDGFFDGVPKTRIFEVALLSALFWQPQGNVPSPTAVRGGDAFFDAAPKSRLFEVALNDTAARPLTPAAQAQGGTAFFDAAQKTRSLEVALLESVALTAFQVPSPTTPQGWHVQWPDRFARTFPTPAQLVSGDTWIGNVQTAFIGNAWIAAWDGPARKLFPAADQRFEVFAPAGDLTSTPQGWPATFPERFARPVPASLQRFDHFPQYQVATATTPQGWWTAAPDSFFRKGNLSHPFDVAFLAAASSVVTYPDGWSVWSPERFAKRFPASAQLLSAFQPQGSIVSITPQGWAVSFSDGRRLPTGVALSRFADDPPTAAATPRGFSVAFPDAVKAVRRASQSVSVDIAAIAANPQGWQADFGTARRRVKPTAADAGLAFAPSVVYPDGWRDIVPILRIKPRPNDGATFLAPPARGNVPSATTPQGWVSVFPDRFAVPVRASLQLFQFMHWWRTVAPASIIAQPTLLGTDAPPTLLGTNMVPTLRGTDAAPSLTGTDAAPTLSGKMALTINLTGKVGA
jgi:hypothetical protein